MRLFDRSVRNEIVSRVNYPFLATRPAIHGITPTYVFIRTYGTKRTSWCGLYHPFNVIVWGYGIAINAFECADITSCAHEFTLFIPTLFPYSVVRIHAHVYVCTCIVILTHASICVCVYALLRVCTHASPCVPLHRHALPYIYLLPLSVLRCGYALLTETI